MSDAYPCEHAVLIEEEPRHHLIIANQYVRAFAVEIAPHERTLCHRHPYDYILYVTGDAEIVSAAKDKPPERQSHHAGECELLPAGLVHVVENLGERPFRNVVVELVPGKELRRGAAPRLVSGRARGSRDSARGGWRGFRLKLEPGAELEIAGPAVLSAPDGGGIVLKEIEEFDHPLDEFRKLAWVCAPRKVWIRNAGAEHGRGAGVPDSAAPGSVDPEVQLCGNRVEFALGATFGRIPPLLLKFFCRAESPVFLRVSSASGPPGHESCRGGVAPAGDVCYNNQVSERHFCRLRMWDRF